MDIVAPHEPVFDKPRAGKSECREFQLFETLKFANGRFVLLERHLKRLGDAARYFGFHCDLAHIRRQLHEYGHTLTGESYRVRLLLSKTGESALDASPLHRLPGLLFVALTTDPVSRRDWSLYHKTTVRDVYERHRSIRRDADEVLLWNEEEEVTEFTTGNLVAELGGIRWTPSVDSGLLAGTMRADLLEKGEIRERPISKRELADASHLWLINSVRGWVPVRLLKR